jgi:hypothetical protein
MSNIEGLNNLTLITHSKVLMRGSVFRASLVSLNIFMFLYLYNINPFETNTTEEQLFRLLIFNSFFFLPVFIHELFSIKDSYRLFHYKILRARYYVNYSLRISLIILFLTNISITAEKRELTMVKKNMTKCESNLKCRSWLDAKEIADGQALSLTSATEE